MFSSSFFSARKLCCIHLTLAILALSSCNSSDLNPDRSARNDEAGQEKILEITQKTLDAKRRIADLQLVHPDLSDNQLQDVLRKYIHLDPKSQIPAKLLAQALAFYDANKDKISNLEYLSVIDFSKSSAEERFFILRLKDGLIERGFISHGSGSDPDDDGFATTFSDEVGSNKSSLGFYLTGNDPSEVQRSSLELDGLSSGNFNARQRGLTLYGASYVLNAPVKQGHSWGGLAIPSEDHAFINLLKGQSLIYAGLSSEAGNFQRPSTQAYDVEAAPLWEAKRLSDGRDWTLFSMEAIKTYGASLLAGTNDMHLFCPAYSTLTMNQKLNFWTYLISAVVKYESSFRPTVRYQESTMGIDPVTTEPVYSEGLLQLSYQDVIPYPFCNEFDWQVDQHISRTDPRKTIFDPYKNLKCGIRILNKIVERKKLISFDSGHYWHTLKPKSQSQPEILALVSQLPFCQP